MKKRSREMGIWQVAAAAHAIGRPVLSVYPQLGWESYQTINNRMLMPGTADPFCAQKPLHIMWTSSRKDMTPIHWTADHFVPLLPLTDPDQEVLVTDDEDNAPSLLLDISTTPAVDLQDELYFVLGRVSSTLPSSLDVDSDMVLLDFMTETDGFYTWTNKEDTSWESVSVVITKAQLELVPDRSTQRRQLFHLVTRQ